MLTNDPPRSTHRENVDVSPNRCGEMQQDPSCCDKQLPCTNLHLRLGPGDVDGRYEQAESHRELVTILRQHADHTQAQQLYGLMHHRSEVVCETFGHAEARSLKATARHVVSVDVACTVSV